MITQVIRMRYFLISNLFAAFTLISCAQKQSSTMNTTNLSSITNSKTDTATFGAGCFWCVEAVFQQLDGVLKVTSGYSGGHVVNPTYEQVCSKTTGHVEVAQIIYDPAKITFDDLLQVFWKTHDPTTIDQQGNDQGPQYRSVVFYHNDEQKKATEHYKDELNKSGAWASPIVTSIEPLKKFYVAEDYHQNYYNANSDQMYCRYVIQPKLEKFQKVFKDKLKKSKS
ncbi:MAG: peptide-methionine (S)-S-oxide reductase [Segetibacter sp.]|jgi:peptide-methionine (S)-S-oxide reductase|nr:peptide-methionine (S)-S-oxide reductase [Segetibacter sp.]